MLGIKSRLLLCLESLLLTLSKPDKLLVLFDGQENRNGRSAFRRKEAKEIGCRSHVDFCLVHRRTVCLTGRVCARTLSTPLRHPVTTSVALVTNSFLLLLAWHFVTRSVALVTTGLKTEAHLICNYSNFKKDAKELNDGFLCRVKLAQAELKSVFLWGLLSPLIQLLHKVVGGLTKNHSKARKRTKTSCNSFRFSIRFSRFHTVFCRLRRKSLNIRPTNLAFSSILAMASNLLCRNSCGKTESPQWAHCAIFLCLPPLPILVLCHRFSEYCASFAIILCPLSNRVL